MDDPVLVIVVNYGLAGQIDALLASGALVSHRVLLVDNASDPDAIVEIGRRYGVETLLLGQNYGFAGAVNRAVRHAAPAPFVLLLNPDVRMRPSAVTALQRRLAEESLTGVAPLLVTLDGSLQVAGGGSLTTKAFLVYFLFLSHLVPRAKGVFYTRRQLRWGLPPAWLGMACLLVRGDAFTTFGPIPEDERVYGEDLAWGVKASANGARFAIAADVFVTHEQGAAGASERWSGALARLAVRELGPVKGRVASGLMWTGLRARRLLGRPLASARPNRLPAGR